MHLTAHTTHNTVRFHEAYIYNCVTRKGTNALSLRYDIDSISVYTHKYLRFRHFLSHNLPICSNNNNLEPYVPTYYLKPAHTQTTIPHDPLCTAPKLRPSIKNPNWDPHHGNRAHLNNSKQRNHTETLQCRYRYVGRLSLHTYYKNGMLWPPDLYINAYTAAKKKSVRAKEKKQTNNALAQEVGLWSKKCTTYPPKVNCVFFPLTKGTNACTGTRSFYAKGPVYIA